MLLHSVDPVVVMKLDLYLVLHSGLYLVVGLMILDDFDTLPIVYLLDELGARYFVCPT